MILVRMIADMLQESGITLITGEAHGLFWVIKHGHEVKYRYISCGGDVENLQASRLTTCLGIKNDNREVYEREYVDRKLLKRGRLQLLCIRKSAGNLPYGQPLTGSELSHPSVLQCH
jgi:hypothetical protein